MAVTVTTGQPYYVRGTSGFFKGELTDLDTQASVDCYFQYRIKLAATWSDTSAAAETMSALGEFVSAQIALIENETYEVRAVATWDDGGAQYAYGSTVEFDAAWIREGSEEDFERGILDGVQVVGDALKLTATGDPVTYPATGNRQKPYLITDTSADIAWTATTPANTTLTVEAQVQGTTAITDEAVGTGDGTTTVFYLDHWPANTPTVTVNAVAETGFTLGNDRRTMTFTTAPADTHAILASYTAVDDAVVDAVEIQELDLDDPTGGTFKLGDGTSWTADIAYDATAATIETALEGLYGAGTVEVSVSVAPYSAKSVILDIADNWGSTSFLGLRAVDFWHDGSKITNLAADFTAYATTTSSSNYAPAYAFDTSVSKTGSPVQTSWLSDSFANTNQRLICVFDSEITFDEVRVHPYHNSGYSRDYNAKNVVINISSDSITDTTYNASISNSTEIFDGQFDEHGGGDVEDEQTLVLPVPTAATITFAHSVGNSNLTADFTGLT